MTEKVVIHGNEMVVLSKVARVVLVDEHKPEKGASELDYSRPACSQIYFMGNTKPVKMSREIGEKIWTALKGRNL